MTIQVSKVLASRPPLIHQQITPRDAILYNLGIGAGEAGVEADLRYLWETQLETFPTIAATLAMDMTWLKAPELGVTWSRMVHAEEDIEWLGPLPVSGMITGRTLVEDVVDKGHERGALLKLLRTLTDAEGRLLARVRSCIFLRQDGGFGGTIARPSPRPSPPPHAPDATVVFQTRPEQAFLYRLSGDDYALHIDPATALQSGFSRPILHGLATYGFAARAVVNGVLDGDASRLNRFSGRFVAPVYPGDALKTEIWPVETGFFVRMSVGDRVVFDSGHAIAR